jgi:hypothetical protein
MKFWVGFGIYGLVPRGARSSSISKFGYFLSRSSYYLSAALANSALPGDRSVTSGTLDHIPIDQHSSYVALSYTWTDGMDDDAECDSDNDEDDYILLEGHYFHVASNLFAALRQLRLPSEERQFWVNAICIYMH